MVSTPNGPGGLFERIEENQRRHASTSVYCSTILMVLRESTLDKK